MLASASHVWKQTHHQLIEGDALLLENMLLRRFDEVVNDNRRWK